MAGKPIGQGLSAVAGAVALCFASAAAEPEELQAVPFPVAKTVTLRDEKAVYFVEGRVRIPKGVEITVLRDQKIVGRGKDATIEVEGKLAVHGVDKREVIFEGVTIEPQPTFEWIRIDQTIFRKDGGLRTRKGSTCSGYFMLELLDFIDKAKLELAMTDGSVELSSVCSEMPVLLRGVDVVDNKGNTVKVEIRGCVQQPMFECAPHKGRIGLRGGLVVESANEVIVRLSRLAGGLTAIRDWRQGLIFDGNKVNSKRLEFTAPAAGRFSSRAQLFKCDVYSEKVHFAAPPARPGSTEDAYFERWWFATAGTDKAAVMKVVEDGSAAPETNGVRARIGKLNDRALELAGPLDR